MKLIFESDTKSSTPFFSVCMETYNRGKTIYRALESVSNQLFKDFECILIDDCSTDETLEEVKRFIASPAYATAPFPFKVSQNEYRLGGILNWNEPLKQATGKYIAVLEGDDSFHKDHLQKAANVLQDVPNIGIYATGNQRATRPLKGRIAALTYFNYTYQLINVSPPSETIFIRLRKNGQPFMYDGLSFTYAPEIQ
jgi:glycosyltransferase involved in cell wall biosynthesis